MAAASRFLTAGDGVTVKVPAMIADAAEGDVRKTKGGSGAKTRDTRAEDTARTARRGDVGALGRVFFLRGRQEGVRAADDVAAAAGDRKRFCGSEAMAAAAMSSRDGVDGRRARTSPRATS